MNNEYNPANDRFSPDHQTLSFNHGEPASLHTSEDDKVTLRLAPQCTKEGDLLEDGFYPYQPFDGFAEATTPLIQPLSADELTEIELAQLTPQAQILIETAHSVYHFTVINPQHLYGKLIGGILGNQTACATLKFSCSEHDQPMFTAQRLKLGMSIVFNIEWGKTFRQLMTSAITRLQLRSEPAGHQPAIEKRLSNSAFITLPLDDSQG